MRILITGGAGCLGSNLIEHWLPQGHDILVIDNFATGRREVVPAGLDRLTVIEGSDSGRGLPWTGPSTRSSRRMSFIRPQPTRIRTTGARMWRPT